MRKEDMDCKEIFELLAAYLDGEVTPEEKTSIEVHLPGCPQCRAELEALSAARDSLRGVLKLMAEGVSPQVRAWKGVRARLDTDGSWLDGLHRLLTGRAWQAATVTAAVVLIAVVAVIWQFGGGGQSPTPTPTATRTPAPPTPTATPKLELSAMPSQDSYLPGEQVNIEFLFSNTDTEPITVTTFPPEIEILTSSPYVAVRSFAAGEQELALGPREEIPYNLTWDQRDNNGKQVSPGWYFVDVKNMRATTATGSMGLSITTITRVLIQFPQGAMEKTIEMNQPQTVNGITITLERVELSVKGTIIYAFATPPGYSLPQQSPDFPLPTPPDWMVPVSAQYTVDGVTKDGGTASVRLLGNGVELRWGRDGAWLDPVPSDAKELIFTITGFGDWQGPWEFRIPLD